MAATSPGARSLVLPGAAAMGVSTFFEFLGTEPFRLTVTQLVLDCLGLGTRRSALVSSCKRGHAIANARFDDELAATVQARATDTARYEFDPAGFSQDTEFPLYICGAELKHARFAILAWLNLVVPGVSRIPFPGEPWSSNSRRSLLLDAYNAADGKETEDREAERRHGGRVQANRFKM